MNRTDIIRLLPLPQFMIQIRPGLALLIMATNNGDLVIELKQGAEKLIWRAEASVARLRFGLKSLKNQKESQSAVAASLCRRTPHFALFERLKGFSAAC